MLETVNSRLLKDLQPHLKYLLQQPDCNSLGFHNFVSFYQSFLNYLWKVLFYLLKNYNNEREKFTTIHSFKVCSIFFFSEWRPFHVNHFDFQVITCCRSLYQVPISLKKMEFKNKIYFNKLLKVANFFAK